MLTKPLTVSAYCALRYKQPGSAELGGGARLDETFAFSDGDFSKWNMFSSVLACALLLVKCWLAQNRFSIKAKIEL